MATVFVLEDDHDLRNLYSRALNFRGHNVAVASSAAQALDMLYTGDVLPDVAVLDMSMPGLPGSAVVEFIRNESNLPDLPIIVVSCDDNFRHELRWATVTFMAKPINLSDLYAAVTKAVS